MTSAFRDGSLALSRFCRLFLLLQIGFADASRVSFDDDTLEATRAQAWNADVRDERPEAFAQLAASGMQNSTAADYFFVSVMVSPAILNKMMRKELPLLLQAAELSGTLRLSELSTLVASPGGSGGIRLMVTDFAVSYGVLSLPSACLVAEVSISANGESIRLTNLELRPGTDAPVQQFFHNLVAPFQRVLLGGLAKVVQAIWADYFATLACFNGEYEVTLPSVAVDEHGNFGVGLAFSKVGKERATKAPVPLWIMNTDDHDGGANLAVFWSHGMLEAMSGSWLLDKFATHWILTSGSDWFHRTIASWSGVQATAAIMINQLLYLLGVSNDPHLETLQNTLHHVETTDPKVDGIVDILDATNGGAGILSALYSQQELQALLNAEVTDATPVESSEPSAFTKGACT